MNLTTSLCRFNDNKNANSDTTHNSPETPSSRKNGRTATQLTSGQGLWILFTALLSLGTIPGVSPGHSISVQKHQISPSNQHQNRLFSGANSNYNNKNNIRYSTYVAPSHHLQPYNISIGNVKLFFAPWKISAHVNSPWSSLFNFTEIMFSCNGQMDFFT